MRKWIAIAAAAGWLASICCTGDAPKNDGALQQQAARAARVASAGAFTERCAASRLSSWNIHGAAAGSDCRVLLVDTSMILEDSTIEAMHYGTGAESIGDGGVERFSRDRAFRGVAYRDRTGRLWTFGDVSRPEAEHLQPCR